MSSLFGSKGKNRSIEKCDALYTWHKDVLYRMALDAVGGDREWALSLLEQCVIIACENIDKFEDERSDKSASIMTAILQKLINEIYSEVWQKMEPKNKVKRGVASPKDKFDVNQVLIRNAFTAGVTKHLERLTNSDKKFIFMRFFMGFDEKEVADYFKEDEDDVEKMVFEVKQKISKMIVEGS